MLKKSLVKSCKYVYFITIIINLETDHFVFIIKIAVVSERLKTTNLTYLQLKYQYLLFFRKILKNPRCLPS